MSTPQQPFTATFDANALNNQLRSLSRMDQFGSFSRALSRAGQSMRKQAIVEVGSVLNLRAGPVRDVVNLRRVERRDLSANLVVTAKGLRLGEFKGVRQTRRGLSVQPKKRGARKILRSGFLIRGRSSGKILAVRRRFRSGESGPQFGRLPLDDLYSTSVREALEDERMQRRILDAGLRRFGPELQREITRRLGGAI